MSDEPVSEPETGQGGEGAEAAAAESPATEGAAPPPAAEAAPGEEPSPSATGATPRPGRRSSMLRSEAGPARPAATRGRGRSELESGVGEVAPAGAAEEPSPRPATRALGDADEPPRVGTGPARTARYGRPQRDAQEQAALAQRNTQRMTMLGSDRQVGPGPVATGIGLPRLGPLLFPFALGVALGAVGGVLAVSEPGLEPPAPLGGNATASPIVPDQPAMIVSTFPVGARRERISFYTLDPGAADPALAEALEVGLFERDWGPVAAAARVLRGRHQQAEAAAAVSGGSGWEEIHQAGSLLALDHEYRRRAALLELKQRDNEATRLLKSDLPPDDIEARLRDLFLRPALAPGDDRVRRDAATMLARLGGESARAILLQALDDPTAGVPQVAAEALAGSDEPAAVEALLAIAQADRDPGKRVTALRALGQTRGLAAGGDLASQVARLAETEPDAAVRRAALASLGAADLGGSAAARAALTATLLDPAPPAGAQEAALEAMSGYARTARTLPDELLDALERQVSFLAPARRLAALELLGQVGRSESLTVLESAPAGTWSEPERAALQAAITALRQRYSR